jgi:hypothetical protein
MVADTGILKLWEYGSSMGMIHIVSGIHRMIAKPALTSDKRSFEIQLRSLSHGRNTLHKRIEEREFHYAHTETTKYTRTCNHSIQNSGLNSKTPTIR